MGWDPPPKLPNFGVGPKVLNALYLIKMLKEMKEVRDSDENSKMPEHPNIKNMNAIALFRMLDPMGHGKVPASSLKEILDVYSLFDNENSQLYREVCESLKSGGGGEFFAINSRRSCRARACSLAF